jgi:hypothetical protein
MMLKIYGLIGDCPALSLALNHNSHGGYYCCWYCMVEGNYIDNKVQYNYDKSIKMRDSASFTDHSKQAEQCWKTFFGRLGLSVFQDLVDIPLPKSLITDYMHVSLLGEGKMVCKYLYKLMKPAQRRQLDQQMHSQKFPHHFNRKIKSFGEGHHKYKSMIENIVSSLNVLELSKCEVFFFSVPYLWFELKWILIDLLI